VFFPRQPFHLNVIFAVKSRAFPSEASSRFFGRLLALPTNIRLAKHPSWITKISALMTFWQDLVASTSGTRKLNKILPNLWEKVTPIPKCEHQSLI
jgi:hypothetical protein